MVRPGPAGAIVEQPLFEIIIERPLRFASMPRNRGRAPLVALLKAADAPEIAADAAGEMRELDLQRRQLVEEPAVDDPDRRHHERELPAEHAAEVVGVELRPGNDLRQRMDEHIKPEIAGRTPERPQRFGIERLTLQLRADDNPRKAELDRTALELGGGLAGLQGGNMGKRNEPAGMIVDRLPHAIVDQTADGEIGLIEARATREHAGINPGLVHHAHVRGEIGEQWIEQIIWIAVRIEPRRDRVAIAFEKLGRRIVLLEIDDHVSLRSMPKGAVRAAARARP